MALSLLITKLSALLTEITSNNNGDFYWLNCLHSFLTKNKLKSHEQVCKDHYFFDVIMPNEKNKILKYSQHLKSIRAPFLI